MDHIQYLLQNYWWFLISLLGAFLVFMLFVQGGQSMLLCAKDELSRSLIVNLLGRKWELTFTTLVVFGGAFFASFPLFYSTSFGGAYWLWMLILLSFVLQAVSYEFRR
ncbi:MAG: cytochrome d ubiquinol oxidase subunit II, partial [Muribaculaceae bacterium]|nr:cytochrome d ubiquinol oxidase subunit II [Muribaculaceae bacterium]